jgi:hypothetical protein
VKKKGTGYFFYFRRSKRQKSSLSPFLFFLILFFLTSPGFAEVDSSLESKSWIEDAGFENQHTLRVSIRSDADDYDFYLNRLQAYLKRGIGSSGQHTLRFLPFFEYQHNLDSNTWWRREAGAEIGVFFFKECFYWGASFQHVWQQKENYIVQPLEETTEWVSRFVSTPPLKWWLFKDKLKLRVINEYTYDFSRGQATFSEVAVVLDWRLYEGLRMPVGWRHIDRVHDYDSDLLEFSLLFSF